MYISIDKEKMRFLHKHADYRVVCCLDFIANRQHCDICPIDGFPYFMTVFRNYTEMELKQLYRNTTGNENTPVIGDNLRMVLTELAEQYPICDADPHEVGLQSHWIEQKDPQGVPNYMYVKGATVPARTDDLLFDASLPGFLPSLTQEAAKSAVQKHTALGQQRIAGTPATQVPPSTATAPAMRKTASRPRSGVCKQIWEVLDMMLKETGEIPSRERVKELAAQHGWNKNTASVQSAAWRKENKLP